MSDDLDKIFSKHISHNLYPDELIAFAEALTEWKDREVVKAKAIIEFNYYEHGQICQVSTLQLQPKQTTQIQLDRMPGHFITIEHKASLADTESNKEGGVNE